MVKRAIIAAAVTSSILLIGTEPTKPVITREPIKPIFSKTEVVREAEVQPETYNGNLWNDFISYIKNYFDEIEIPKTNITDISETEEINNDGAGDTGRVEGTGEDTSTGDYGRADESGTTDEVSESYLDGSDGAESITYTDTEDSETEALTYAGEWTITFYCDCPECCGKWSGMNSTASGNPPIPWYTIAAGPSYPFGTLVYIDGFGTFEVMDRGVGDQWADIFVSNHGEIPSYGITTASVYIVG